MSETLDPISIPFSEVDNNTIQIVNLAKFPSTIIAIRISNFTPWVLRFSQLPGVDSIWLMPFTEDIIKVEGTAATTGNIAFTPFQALVQDINNNNRELYITVYQTGDTVPEGGYPLTHNSSAVLTNSGKRFASDVIASNTFTGGAAGSVTLNAGYPFGATNFGTDGFGQLVYTVLDGFAVTFGTPTSAVFNNMTISGLFDNQSPGSSLTMSFRVSQVMGANLTITQSFNSGVKSSVSGSSNGIVLSVPAMSGGASYDIAMWGHADY